MPFIAFHRVPRADTGDHRFFASNVWKARASPGNRGTPRTAHRALAQPTKTNEKRRAAENIMRKAKKAICFSKFIGVSDIFLPAGTLGKKLGPVFHWSLALAVYQEVTRTFADACARFVLTLPRVFGFKSGSTYRKSWKYVLKASLIHLARPLRPRTGSRQRHSSLLFITKGYAYKHFKMYSSLPKQLLPVQSCFWLTTFLMSTKISLSPVFWFPVAWLYWILASTRCFLSTWSLRIPHT